MSDQDFFFDEEDEKPARAEKAAPKTAAKGGSKPAAKTPAAKSTAAAEPAGEGFLFEDMTVTKGIAMLAVACALLLGLAVGLVVGQNRAASTVGTTEIPAASSGQGTAPQLSEEQLNSGQLPPGHPSLGATGSAETTGK